MNVANDTYAPAGETDWDRIQWHELDCKVKRLQARIIKVV